MYFSKKEKEIIRTFYRHLDTCDMHTMYLTWNRVGAVTAVFDTCFENDNALDMDDKDYEEFISFIFKAIKVSGTPPIHVSEDGYFLLNYHNFPDEIFVDGKKIN